MAMTKCPNVVFERPLVLKIRPTNAIPKLATILLMGPPITLDSKWLATFLASE